MLFEGDAVLVEEEKVVLLEAEVNVTAGLQV